jgi:hypothetical protein
MSRLGAPNKAVGGFQGTVQELQEGRLTSPRRNHHGTCEDMAFNHFFGLPSATILVKQLMFYQFVSRSKRFYLSICSVRVCIYHVHLEQKTI